MTPQVQLQEAFKLALSMTLFYWLALWMNWDLPKFGALAIVVVSLSTTGASLNKGVMRVAGRWSRRIHKSGVAGSASTSREVPLIFRLNFAMI